MKKRIMSNFRLVSDGTRRGTKVYYGEEQLLHVKSVELVVDYDGVHSAKLEVIHLEADVEIPFDQANVTVIDYTDYLRKENETQD